MTSVTNDASAADGIELLERIWEPTAPRRGAVALVHGIAEHSGRYEHVGAGLAGLGLEVRARDLRGFGGSGGPRAYVDRFDQYLDDLAGLVTEVSGLPGTSVLLGHSMGGLIALLYATSDRPPPDLLILSAPSLTASVSAAKRRIAPLIARLAPRWQLPNRLDGSSLSRDPAVAERYFSDPLVHPRTTTRLGAELFRAMGEGTDAVPELRIPTLVLHGADDPIVPPESTVPLGALPGVDRILFPAFRHEIFNEEDGGPALDAVGEWLQPRLAQPAAS